MGTARVRLGLVSRPRKLKRKKMLPSVSKAAIVDTGFWYALFDPTDDHHAIATLKRDIVESFTLALPWPCLYETINTRFVKNKLWVQQFEILLKRPRIVLVDDRNYRDRAYQLTMQWSLKARRAIGLVDMVMRFMLDDVNLRVGYLLTFNPGNFVDICRKRRIELLL